MYKMLVIGLSAGGFPLIKKILAALPVGYPLPIAIVSHLPSGHESYLAGILNEISLLPVSNAHDKEQIIAGHVYLAPPDYHLLIEKDQRFALSVDEPVMSVRPSINVLFVSAAEVFEEKLIAVLLSGANSDGAEGMVYVKKLGGLGIVLDPKECEFSTMSTAVINRVEVDFVVGIDEIIGLLLSVHEPS